MKRKLDSHAAGKYYALICTLVGCLIGTTGYIAYDTTTPLTIILVLSAILAIAAYILLVRIVDSPKNFAQALLRHHTIISVLSVILSFISLFILDNALGLFVLCLAWGIALFGYLAPVLHQLIGAIRRRNQK